jgi:hypothetical protein
VFRLLDGQILLHPVLIFLDSLAQVAKEVKFFHRANERKEKAIFRWSIFEDYGILHRHFFRQEEP